MIDAVPTAGGDGGRHRQGRTGQDTASRTIARRVNAFVQGGPQRARRRVSATVSVNRGPIKVRTPSPTPGDADQPQPGWSAVVSVVAAVADPSRQCRCHRGREGHASLLRLPRAMVPPRVATVWSMSRKLTQEHEGIRATSHVGQGRRYAVVSLL
jgi:hypothetical protein